MFELLDLLRSLDDVVANGLEAVGLEVLQGLVDDDVERPEGRAGDHRALQEALVLHLDEAFRGQVGAGT